MHAARRPAFVLSSIVIAAGLGASYHLARPRQIDKLEGKEPQQKAIQALTKPSAMEALQNLPSFQTTFAVPMHCQSCVNEIESAVRKVDGISTATASLPASTLHTTGTAPPSAILSALHSTGRDAVLRGSGASDSAAAVAILETYAPLPVGESPVRGLVRLVEVAEGISVVDISIGGAGARERERERGEWVNGERVGRLGGGRLESGSAEGEEVGEGVEEKKSLWTVTLRQCGDLSRGPDSTGGIYTGADMGLAPIVTAADQKLERGALGSVEVDASGRGSAVLVHPIGVWEVIGRGVVVEEEGGGEKVAGVVARSAGVWDNDKTVCSCSGKTVWEEREEQRGRGML